jgi:hypothetical protein
VSTESSIEVRKIAKSDIERYRADTTISETRIGKHPMRARKSLAEDEGREGQSVAFTKFVNVTRGNTLPLGDSRNRKSAVCVSSDLNLAKNPILHGLLIRSITQVTGGAFCFNELTQSSRQWGKRFCYLRLQ